MYMKTNLSFVDAAIYAFILYVINVGAMAIPGTVIGQVVGGYVCRKFSLGVRGMLRFCLVCVALSLVLIPCILARCPTTILAGVSKPYNSS